MCKKKEKIVLKRKYYFILLHFSLSLSFLCFSLSLFTPARSLSLPCFFPSLSFSLSTPPSHTNTIYFFSSPHHPSSYSSYSCCLHTIQGSAVMCFWPIVKFRFLQAKRWFGEDGELIMLPDPLRPTPSRPPMPEEMEPYLETVFRKVHRTFIYISFLFKWD